MCGNRTEQCQRCKEFILKKNTKEHYGLNNCISFEAKKQVINPQPKAFDDISAYNRRLPPPFEEEKRKRPGFNNNPVKSPEIPRSEVKNFEEEKKKMTSFNASIKNKQDSKSVSRTKTPVSNQRINPNKETEAKTGNSIKTNIVKTIPARTKTINNPSKPVISSKIEPKVMRQEEFLDEKYIDEIPYNFSDNIKSPTPERKSSLEYSESERFRREIEQFNLIDEDEQILKAVIEESKKENLGLSEEERILNEIVLKSLKEK